VIGTGVFTVFVENMDRSLAFYHDVFGMEVPPLPPSGERPYNNPNPRLFAMFDMPGARERHQSARLPDSKTTVEVMDVQDVDHKTVPLRLQDPGATTLVLLVRDLDATITRISATQVAIATPGGKPVALADGSRAILIRDIDNRFIELRQPALIPNVAGDVVGMALSIAVGNLPRTEQVYRDVLGFNVESGKSAYVADHATQALTGLSKATVRRSRMQAPGSTLWIELVEFKGVDRTPLNMRIQDRGAARLQLRAQNIDALVSRVKAAGLTVVSQGGTAVPIPPTSKALWSLTPTTSSSRFSSHATRAHQRDRPDRSSYCTGAEPAEII
jgi:catechol 2,3-dioxygenase-like lactoylglutathione lyase family enzyme